MKKKWKIILGSAAAVIILGIIIFEITRPLKTDLLEVKPCTITKTFEEGGKVIPDVEKPIYPDYSGKIINLPVEEGETVKKGDLLAVIDSSEIKLQLKQLRAELNSIKGEEAQSFEEPYELKLKKQKLQLEKSEEELQSAQNNFNRLKQLYKADAISKSKYEDTEKILNIARKNWQQQKIALSLLQEKRGPNKQYYKGRKDAIRAQIDLLNYKVKNNSLTAPLDGIISELNIKESQVVTPGAPVMNIFQKNSYLVQVYILTEDAANIKTGKEVELIKEINDKDIKFKGTVVKVAPTAVKKMSVLGLEEHRVKVKIKPHLPETIDLKPGYELDVKFTTGKKENQLVVPKTAIFPYKDGDALWVVRNGKAEVQPVQKGFENEQKVAVTKGVKKGDSVILNPQVEGIEKGKKIIDK
ncbi:MAG: efflux RND transporter periplasmic adaptor subunit [Clostridiales bacterium]|nr:efflux RND transporter periplasmic adaptor subunit [Clostridiales bacterium]MCF8023766.1 efflux RND transporter periplasmic adaptor subunit [Clostridiales bacterium]